jgi:alpha-amylase
MPSICLYFQVHQPYRLRKYSIFDAQNDPHYFDEEKNKQILIKVAERCYLPANKLILDLIRKSHGKFKVAYSITGSAMEQFIKYYPEVLASFRSLALTGCVEFLSETYYHSLASIFSKEEFIDQINKHRELMIDNFDYAPKTFRNTELIYNNNIARIVDSLGFTGILAEGADQLLGWRSPNFVYKPTGTCNLKLLLRNYKLSDDIAYRFSNKAWTEYPLTAVKFANWLNEAGSSGKVVNLFMDYETFGEHHAKDSGILDFLASLPKEILSRPGNEFALPSEITANYPAQGEIDAPESVSWADSQRDISAWLGNNMQNDAAIALYKLEADIKSVKNKALLDDWRRLTSADHLYYISTKHFADGEVHKYFSPYRSPYDAFINFMNIMENVRKRLYALKSGQTGVVTGKPKPAKKITAQPKQIKKTAIKKVKPKKEKAKKIISSKKRR